MGQEFSAGVVIYRRTSEGIKYLLLHAEASNGFNERIEFPKGKIQEHENPEDAAIREVKEETGITDLDFDIKFKEKNKFFYQKGGETIFKEVTFFLAETKQEEIKISKEHNSYLWATAEKAIKKLRFADQKELVKKAEQVLKQKHLEDYD